VLYIIGTGGDFRMVSDVLDRLSGLSHHVISYYQGRLSQSEEVGGEYTMKQYAHDAAPLVDLAAALWRPSISTLLHFSRR
jgi:hypothetical protein